jgi:hypothetical protein
MDLDPPRDAAPATQPPASPAENIEVLSTISKVGTEDLGFHGRLDIS